jgi:hypothetical protein
MADIYTDAGEDWTADVFDGTSSPPANYFVGWGTGAGTAAKTDTTLFTEASEARVTVTESQPSSNVNQGVGTLTADGAKTITNAGLFDQSTGGSLIVHGDHTGVVLALNDKIEYTITITWS